MNEIAHSVHILIADEKISRKALVLYRKRAGGTRLRLRSIRCTIGWCDGFQPAGPECRAFWRD